VLVVDRNRVTTSPYFNKLRTRGFGVWKHDGSRFYPILPPKRRAPLSNMRRVVERQFRNVGFRSVGPEVASLSNWLQPTFDHPAGSIVPTG